MKTTCDNCWGYRVQTLTTVTAEGYDTVLHLCDSCMVSTGRMAHDEYLSRMGF